LSPEPIAEFRPGPAFGDDMRLMSNGSSPRAQGAPIGPDAALSLGKESEDPMKAMPQIQKVMTPMPHTIGKDIPMTKALELMREHQIRHLPVQDGGQLVGIVTDRDVKLAASFSRAVELTAEDVMTPDPYSVGPETPLDEVVRAMADHKYGCAIVRQANGKVVGIFTNVDGMRVLSDELVANHRSRA
jgi:acetoin utilization protein AcuB